MKKLSELFKLCDSGVHYQQIGDSVNYAFVEEGRTLYIYFQGSNSITDWVRNFWFFPKGKKPYKDMDISYKVHSGFLAAWKTVEDLVIAKIKEVKNPKAPLELQEPKWKQIIVVGYSHGAALAGLCHECVWFHRPDLREYGLEGYGFESPRFYAGFRVKKGLKERWKHFTVIRVKGDIVTHAPPRLFAFCHTGSMLKIKGDTSIIKDNIPRCIKAHFPQVVYQALLDFEKDHD